MTEGRFVMLRAVLVALTLIASAHQALAHDAMAYKDPDRGKWFESLKMPGSGSSCCNLSDCKVTEAEWRDNQWWAVVRGSYGQAWKAIPPDKVLLHPKSIDGEAYVCYSPAATQASWVTIYCFIPPLDSY